MEDIALRYSRLAIKHATIAYPMCSRWVNEVACSSDVILNTRVSDVLKVVIMAAHVSGDIVLLQQWLELLNEGVCWAMLSD